jgi:hypothetical protein
MRQITIAVFAVLLIYIVPSQSSACTSFAVYSEQTIYGMNFDYTPDMQQLFSISTGVQGKVFQFRPYGFSDMAGMNSQGLFATCHGLIPEGKPPAVRNKNHISTWMFHQMVSSRFEKVGQVEQFLQTRQVVQSIGTSMHNLVADRYGQAMVVEPGGNGHRISRIRNRYMVMSSFPYYQLIGKSYDEAEGDGADRFKIAHRYIKSNLEGFAVEKGMEVLKLARNTSGAYQTRCSMVFDPQKGEIYISLEANFDRIWKVDLKSQTIETHRGFSSSRHQSIPATGLLASELMDW